MHVRIGAASVLKLEAGNVGSDHAAAGRRWPPLAAVAGRRWPPLAAAGRRWPPLAAAGRRWPPLAAAGRRWPPLAAAGRRRFTFAVSPVSSALGSCRLLRHAVETFCLLFSQRTSALSSP
ncbi:uncharacterized protein V6R79_011092 [Siganus canaliculatus]